MDRQVNVKFGGDTSDLNQKIDVVTAKTVGYSKSLQAAMAEYDANATKNLNNVQSGMDGVSFKTAGTTREFIVLGREVMTGNFSRIPGSLLVLANRMGGLQSVLAGVTLSTVGWTAAIVGVVAGLYEWASATEHLAETQNEVKGAMELNNQALSYSDKAVKDYIYQLRILADVSSSDAQKIAVSFARAGNLSEDLREKLIKMVGDYAAATGKEAPAAAEELIKMFSEPDKGAKDLANTFKGVLTPAQLEQIDLMKKNGSSAQDMAEVLLSDVGPKLDEFRAKHLTTMQKALEGIRDDWVNLFSGKGISGSNFEAFSAAQKQARGTTVTPPAGPDVDAQNHQNALNEAEMRGLEVLKTVHLEQEKINDLTEKRRSLIAAASAAEEKGDFGLAQKYKDGVKDITNEITKIKREALRQQTADARKAAEEQIAIERGNANTALQISKLRLEGEKEDLEALVADGKITKEQEYAALQDLENREYALESNALEQELLLDNLSLRQKAEINNKIEILYAQHQRNLARIRRDAMLEEQREEKALQTSIGQSMDQMLRGILNGTQTWKQAMGRLFSNLGLTFLEEVAKKTIVAWAASALQKLGITKAFNATMAALGAEQVSTEAATQHAADVANNTAKITADGALTFAGVFANLAPTMGPLAAGPAAAAEATVLAQMPQATLDVGAWNVPHDMIAQIHEGETVVPKTFAEGLRDGGGLGGGGNISITIQAIDTQSGAKFLRDNAHIIAQSIAGQSRKFNKNVPGWRS